MAHLCMLIRFLYTVNVSSLMVLVGSSCLFYPFGLVDHSKPHFTSLDVGPNIISAFPCL